MTDELLAVAFVMGAFLVWCIVPIFPTIRRAKQSGMSAHWAWLTFLWGGWLVYAFVRWHNRPRIRKLLGVVVILIVVGVGAFMALMEQEDKRLVSNWEAQFAGDVTEYKNLISRANSTFVPPSEVLRIGPPDRFDFLPAFTTASSSKDADFLVIFEEHELTVSDGSHKSSDLWVGIVDLKTKKPVGAAWRTSTAPHVTLFTMHRPGVGVERGAPVGFNLPTPDIDASSLVEEVFKQANAQKGKMVAFHLGLLKRQGTVHYPELNQ